MQEILNSLKESQDKTWSDLKIQKNTFDFLNKRIESSENRVERLEYPSISNGCYLWKVKNVQQRIEEAKSERNVCIHSPCFYTSQYECKMCALLYLNGDENSYNTHLSVHISIMKGDYDSLLVWPFQQEISFMLLDQSPSDDKNDIIGLLKPHMNPNSFKCPSTEKNTPCGISSFCSLETLKSPQHEYIKDDCMFIKVKTKNL